MSQYFDRRFEILINDEEFIEQTSDRQFKVTFTVSHDFGGANSYADISIYNLSSDTANEAFSRGDKVTFRAGYVDTIDSIFSGDIQNTFRIRNGPDVITRILARGGRSLNRQSNISTTLGAGALIVDIIRECVTAMGHALIIEPSQFANVPAYPRGQVLNGDPRVYLDNLSNAHQFDYTIENDKVIVVRRGMFRPGDIHEVSQFTGMEGIPIITEVGADVNIRLNPKIRIGGRFQIQSTSATFNFSNLYFQNVPESAGQGVYRIFRVTHSGDTWGDSWTTTIVGNV